MNINKPLYTTNFGARIKINKDLIKAAGFASSASSSAAASTITSMAAIDMPPAQNFAEKAFDSVMYSGMLGSAGTSINLISKAAEYAKKANSKIPS